MKISRFLLLFISALVVLSASGCVTRSGPTWWNPLTWASGSEGRRVERASADQATAREAVLKAAQKTAHETAGHLALAPASRPVALAAESNGVTVSLLDQAAGPLTVEEADKIRAQVAALNSELASVRDAAERQRTADRGDYADVSARLGETTAKLDVANKSLAEGFARENSLANELRNERLMKYAGIAGTVLMGLLAFAWKSNLGGLQQGAAEVIGGLRARYGVKDEDVLAASAALDAYTTPRQQTTIANLAAKAMAEALKTQQASA